MSSESLSRAILPEGWPLPRGYANGMVAEGRVLVTGGLVGWDETASSPKASCRSSSGPSSTSRPWSRAGGGRIEDIVRMTWYVTDIETYRASLKELGPVYRAVLGRHFPAMAVVQVVSLVEPEALVEIEATAVIA